MLMLLGGGLNYGTYAVLIAWIPRFAAWPVLAVAAGSLAGMTVNFITARHLVFHHPPSQFHASRKHPILRRKFFCNQYYFLQLFKARQIPIQVRDNPLIERPYLGVCDQILS